MPQRRRLNYSLAPGPMVVEVSEKLNLSIQPPLDRKYNLEKLGNLTDEGTRYQKT